MCDLDGLAGFGLNLTAKLNMYLMKSNTDHLYISAVFVSMPAFSSDSEVTSSIIEELMHSNRAPGL